MATWAPGLSWGAALSTTLGLLRGIQAQTQPIAISHHPVYEQWKEELACEDPLRQPTAGRPPHSLSSRLLQKPGWSFLWLPQQVTTTHVV